MKFSVVMAVYEKDNSEWLQAAVQSILNQTVRSDDIVIVADGPLTPALDAALHNYEANEKSISIVRLNKNQGLGNALNVGIDQAKNELVARMDADDIAVVNRFELQLAKLNADSKLAIVGGHIAEFTGDLDNIVAYRKVPVKHAEIKEFSRRRSPFNHPTVMYKKSVIQSLGGYDVTAIRIEDYDLWLRALSNGVVCANVDEVLINYRSTVDAMQRRKTFTSLKSHINARHRFYKRGDISLTDFVYGVTTQTVLFVMPVRLASAAFKKVVRNA